MTGKEARELLKVYPAIVATKTPSGRWIDEEGNEVDERETVSWTMALGPFGSWPCTVADAEAEFAKFPEWREGVSFRLGRCVVYRQGWGFQAVEK